MKTHRLPAVLLIVALVLSAASTSAVAQPLVRVEGEVIPTDGESPAGPALALFIENVGQFNEQARFQVWGGGATLWLAEDAIWLTLLEAPPRDRNLPGIELAPEPTVGVNLRLTFPGANPRPRLEPFGRQSTAINYIWGNDPAGWRARAPVWAGVRYADLYPGIDLVIKGAARAPLEWRLEAAEGADLSVVRLRVEGAEGVRMERDALTLATAAGRLDLPLINAGNAVRMPGLHPDESARAIVEANETAFEVATPFAAGAPTALSNAGPDDDPSDLIFSTYLGGSDHDWTNVAALDADENVIIVGETESSDFPVSPGAFDPTANGYTTAFVAKLSADGGSLLFGTFFGGSAVEYCSGGGVDAAGNILLTGATWSSDLPTTPGAYDTTHNGLADAFVARLSADGSSLLYGTFIGSEGSDGGAILLPGADGAIALLGGTYSPDFPTTPGAYDTTYNGGVDGFVLELAADGGSLTFGTLFGGSGDDDGRAFSFDSGGNLVFTGHTDSPDFPTTAGAYDTTLDGYYDAFVSKLVADGSSLLYSTYIGGSGSDWGEGLAADSNGTMLMTGCTTSEDFPTTPGAYDTTPNGSEDAFVLKLASEGGSLLFSSFVGGSSRDQGEEVVLDEDGNLLVVGTTNSPDFPTTAGAYDTTHNGDWDGFVFKLASAGDALEYSTYVGGEEHVDEAWAVTPAGLDEIVVAGRTDSSDFPTSAGAYDVTYNGDDDVFVLRLLLDEGPYPIHSISGRVVDGLGDPLPGIVLAASGAGATTTDANGGYMFEGLIPGTYTLTVSTAGYFWFPESRIVTVPPDAAGQDFAGSRLVKRVSPPPPDPVAFSDILTYTLDLIAPVDGTVRVSDPVPTYTTYVSGSLSAPAGVSCDAAASIITGSLTLQAGTPAALSFGARVEVTGTVEFGPLIVNRACLYDEGTGEPIDCDDVFSYTYVYPAYLPLVVR
jgi:hypothetical protein